ncbi:hypothetical protein [Blastopirellula marina]|uniref:Uncharacterized protein n=1 Tax=Blastopirellula marina TaxID=124 RepID=A0A2S8GDG5_9BACT|nr:hypothetical protein [Blastopirellula marina]PQO42497.1 hypothetical protein C5Y93_29680 [Blastopirellula marina]
MTSLFCLLAVIAAPPAPATSELETPTIAEETAELPSLKPYEVREALREAMIDEASSKTFEERHEATRRMCALMYEVMLNEEFPEGERKKWRARLVSRLRSVRSDMERSLPDESHPGRRLRPARGGGAIDERGAAELIDLITTTISPETWDIHGGTGSIFYYSNLRVLVISHTQEVHEKIGGVNRGLRQGP